MSLSPHFLVPPSISFSHCFPLTSRVSPPPPRVCVCVCECVCECRCGCVCVCVCRHYSHLY
eukprot:jgi/Botrbrau1/1655/Bobra.0185s0065.1